MACLVADNVVDAQILMAGAERQVGALVESV